MNTIPITDPDGIASIIRIARESAEKHPVLKSVINKWCDELETSDAMLRAREQ